MAIPGPGVSLSLSDIQTEFGGVNPIAISEYYGVATGVPASGTISISDFYGTSSGFPPVSLGYFFGGDIPGPSTASRDIYKIVYNTDTLSTLPSNLPTSAASQSGVVQDTSNSYIGGGANASVTFDGVTNNIIKFQFSNETASDFPANLPGSSRGGIMGVSSQSNGYWCGGNNFPNYFTTVSRIQFSNTTISTLPNSLPQIQSNGAPLSTTSTGYLVEGQVQPPTYSPSILKLNYSNETFNTSIGTTPILAMQSFNGAFTDRSNGNGYFYGGFKGIPNVPGPSFYSNTVEKIVFSTDTMSLLPVTTPIGQRSAAGNFSDSAGYISGGLFADGCTVQKFVFSTETFTSPLGGFNGPPSSPSSSDRTDQGPTQV